MELSIVESNLGDIVINPDDASNLGANAGDLISLTQTSTGNRILGIVGIQSDMESGTIGVSPLLLISNELQEGIKIDTSVWQGDLTQINSVELGIENVPGSKKKGDVLQRTRTKESELVRSLKNKAFQKGTSFILKELDLQVTIIDTKPELSKDDAAKFNGIQNFSYTWSKKQDAEYDSVVMIDLSGSMDTADMMMDDKAHETVKAIESKFTDKYGTDLMGRLQDKDMVSRIDAVLGKPQDGGMVSRIDGAALAILNYSQIGGGKKNFGLVYFSDEGIPVTFPDGSRVYNAGSNVPTAELGEAVLGKIVKNWHGLTNLEDGLIKSIEVAKKLDHKKHKMIVLLMDGKPENEEKCLEIINKRIVPRKDMIINTLGYGNKIDEKFLMTVADKTGGEYLNIQDADDLIDAFSDLAVEFKIHGSKETLDLHSIRDKAMEKADPTEVYCKKCGQHATFLGKHSRWYCDNCKKYLGKGSFQNKCIKCKKPLSFLGNSKRWFCYECNAFDRGSR